MNACIQMYYTLKVCLMIKSVPEEHIHVDVGEINTRIQTNEQCTQPCCIKKNPSMRGVINTIVTRR